MLLRRSARERTVFHWLWCDHSTWLHNSIQTTSQMISLFRIIFKWWDSRILASFNMSITYFPDWAQVSEPKTGFGAFGIIFRFSETRKSRWCFPRACGCLKSFGEHGRALVGIVDDQSVNFWIVGRFAEVSCIGVTHFFRGGQGRVVPLRKGRALSKRWTPVCRSRLIAVGRVSFVRFAVVCYRQTKRYGNRVEGDTISL